MKSKAFFYAISVEIFQASLFTVLLIFLIEELRRGFIYNFFDVGWFGWLVKLVIISGFFILLFSNEKYEK